MANFTILKQAQVFIVYNNTKYNLDVTEDIKFSQTFTDNTYAQKTLHEPHKLFNASNIKKANPADFSFTIPMYEQNDLKVVYDLLVDFKSATDFTLNQFDLYIQLPHDLYSISGCVITNGTFMIEKSENLKLAVSGEGEKLVHYKTSNDRSSKLGEIALLTQHSRSSNPTHQKVDYTQVQVDNTTLPSIYKISVELQNKVEWTENVTVQKVLDIDSSTSGDTVVYPSNFVLKERILAGSIGQYVSDQVNSFVQTSKTNVPISILAGKDAQTGFQFNMPSCSFTNRNNVARVFTQSYDWRMNTNTTDLGNTIINFNNS